MLRLVSACGLVALWALAVRGVPVDNGVEGDAEIECGPTSITVNFNTQQPFEGHVYVKVSNLRTCAISNDAQLNTVPEN